MDGQFPKTEGKKLRTLSVTGGFEPFPYSTLKMTVKERWYAPTCVTHSVTVRDRSISISSSAVLLKQPWVLKSCHTFPYIFNCSMLSCIIFTIWNFPTCINFPIGIKGNGAPTPAKLNKTIFSQRFFGKFWGGGGGLLRFVPWYFHSIFWCF